MKKKIFKILKWLFIIICLLVIGSVFFIYQKVNLFTSLVEVDVGNININNADNETYKSGNIYEYSVEILKESVEYGLEVYIDYNFIKNPSLASYKLKPLNKLSNKNKINNVLLEVFQNKTKLSLGNKQTIIEYSYKINDKKTEIINHYTGLVEDSTKVFLHPIRSLWFNSLEYCPFPEFKKNINLGEEWTSTLYIKSSEAFQYSHINKMRFDYSMDSIIDNRVYHFSGKGYHNDEQVSASKFEYTKKEGFITQEYFTIDGFKVTFKLTDTYNKYDFNNK